MTLRIFKGSAVWPLVWVLAGSTQKHSGGTVAGATAVR